MDTALRLVEAGVTRDGQAILGPVDLTVASDERWVVLGPNGCGKSTLLKVAALQLHPSHGTVEVLGELLGRTDVRSLRRRVGYASAALGDSFRPSITARDVVMTARHGALEPWWHTYDDTDRAEALDCLTRLGVGHLSHRELSSLSSGERQRVLVARTLLGDIGLVLLDEPHAGLDVGGREWLVAGLDTLAADRSAPATVLVTHHLEEIPPAFTHVLLLRAGRALVAGPLDEVLTSEAISETFSLPLVVERRNRRWLAMPA